MTIMILLADDHKIFRQGLRRLIESEAGLEVIGEAEDGRGAVDLSRKTSPQVVIMDVSMPDLNGVEATRLIVHDNPHVKVVGLSMYQNEEFIGSMLRAGASGYLRKDCSIEELVEAIRRVNHGHTYLGSSIKDVVVQGYIRKINEPTTGLRSPLTPKEREVLQLVADGKTTKQIAHKLNVSAKTVDSHRRQIMTKLGIKNVADLTKYAIRAGLTTLEG
jgi:two-component system response regulator NreC